MTEGHYQVMTYREEYVKVTSILNEIEALLEKHGGTLFIKPIHCSWDSRNLDVTVTISLFGEVQRFMCRPEEKKTVSL